MVAIDPGIDLSAGRGRRIEGWMLIGGTAAVTALCALIAAFHAETAADEMRSATQAAWRFSSFVFAVAAMAGPFARLFPGLKWLAARERELLFAFCASVAVYLGAALLPLVGHTASGGELPIFAGASLVVLLGITASLSPVPALGARVRHLLFGYGMVYFWLCYAVAALSHIYGPHRPDSYYGSCLCIFIIVLLLRFADDFLLVWRTPRPI